MRNLPWSHKQSSMLPLSFSPILAFLFLLQYLKTYGEQLLNISQWIKMKRLLREVLLIHSLFFLFLYCCCFSPTCPHALACVTCCEWKEHLHTWWQCLSTNELHNPPSLQTIFKSAAPPAAHSAFGCCRGLGTVRPLTSPAHLQPNWSRCYYSWSKAADII